MIQDSQESRKSYMQRRRFTTLELLFISIAMSIVVVAAILVGYDFIASTEQKPQPPHIAFPTGASTTTAPVPTQPLPTGKFCGGIAGLPCPSGYECKLDGTYPDAGGTCVRRSPSASIDPKDICLAADRKWIAEYRECEGLTAIECKKNGGTYNECDSVCRHEPSGTPCILLCVELCTF